MNHLNDFGIYALVGCTNNNFTYLLLKDISSAFWVFKFDAT